MDYLKNNWKTVLVAVIVGVGIVCLTCCEGEAVEAAPNQEVEVLQDKAAE